MLELPLVPSLVGDVTTTESSPGARVDSVGMAADLGDLGQDVHTEVPRPNLSSVVGAPGQEIYGAPPTSLSPVELGVRCGKESRVVTPLQFCSEQDGRGMTSSTGDKGDEICEQAAPPSSSPLLPKAVVHPTTPLPP